MVLDIMQPVTVNLIRQIETRIARVSSFANRMGKKKENIEIHFRRDAEARLVRVYLCTFRV